MNDTHDLLLEAFAILNRELFADELPDCLITYRARKNAAGYFAKDWVVENQGQGKRHSEIALNASLFHDNAQNILATLAHEMVHHWQACFGKPGKGKYHNRQWAAKMLDIGLTPVNLKNPALQTGDNMSHTIDEYGPFLTVYTEKLTHMQFPWHLAEVKKPKAKAKRKRFKCPECKQIAYAGHNATLDCGFCKQPMGD